MSVGTVLVLLTMLFLVFIAASVIQVVYLRARAFRLWTDGESGTVLTVLSTIAGALWAGLIVRRGRYRRCSQPARALVSAIHLV